jgi:DNA-directed RNA polymerase subunit RPC12/RpoP
MTTDEIKRSVIQALENLPFYKVNNTGIQHLVRCPYCGDSRHANHGHFSIKIDVDDPDTPMMYKCFRCNEHGLLTSDVLEDLGLHVSAMDKQHLKLFNRKVAKKNKLTDTCIEQFDLINYERDYDRVRYKIDYINDRLGCNFSSSNIVPLSIVPSILDFFAQNKIKLESLDKTYSPQQLRFIDRNYIGFLSYNKNVLVLRDITGNASQRYLTMTINKNNLDPNGFYSIRNSIDLLYSHQIHVHITEGIMDILNVYDALNNRNLENNYYYAVCGFSYSRVIRGIIRIGINTGLIVHIYADNDKDDQSIINQLKSVSMWIDKLYIHRNGYKDMKDYGVNRNFIKDTSRLIPIE